jgi:hypothetical protein
VSVNHVEHFSSRNDNKPTSICDSRCRNSVQASLRCPASAEKGDADERPQNASGGKADGSLFTNSSERMYSKHSDTRGQLGTSTVTDDAAIARKVATKGMQLAVNTFFHRPKRQHETGPSHTIETANKRLVETANTTKRTQKLTNYQNDDKANNLMIWNQILARQMNVSAFGDRTTSFASAAVTTTLCVRHLTEGSRHTSGGRLRKPACLAAQSCPSPGLKTVL